MSGNSVPVINTRVCNGTSADASSRYTESGLVLTLNQSHCYDMALGLHSVRWCRSFILMFPLYYAPALFLICISNTRRSSWVRCS